MKVAVITRHAIANYGSLLQAIATQKVVEQCGHQCEIVDYIRMDEIPKYWEQTVLSTKNGWNSNPLKKYAYLALRQPESIKAGEKFQEMRRQYLHLTKRYYSLEALETDPVAADVYMTGSDQVWGPTANGSYDTAYFLSFAPLKSKKIAFAASMGKMDISDETRALFQKYLRRYDHITVREQLAEVFLRELGIVSETVLDPTLLIPGEEWGKMKTSSKKDRYVLVYQIHSSSELNAIAKKLAERMHLPLLRVSPVFYQIIRGGKFIYLPDITEFLTLIRNAAFMVTDSFHGTAFAINFNVPFAEVLPDNGTSSRNISILNLLGLSDRIISKAWELERLPETIDYSFCNQMLEDKRSESIKILKCMLAQ